MKEEITKLANCNPTNKQKIISREVFNTAKKLFDIRSNIIKAFENGIFPPQNENLHKEQTRNNPRLDKGGKSYI